MALDNKNIIWDDDVEWDAGDTTPANPYEAEFAANYPGVEAPGEVAGAREVTPRQTAELGAMGIGSLVGGPIGAAGGYALADQLFDKYQEGKEITPGGAAASLGKGALYELLPRTALMGAGKLIPKGLDKRLAQFSLSPAPAKGTRHADRVIKAQMDKDLTVSKEGLAKAEDIIRSNAAQVRTVAKEMEAAGVTVDPVSQIYAPMIRHKEKLKDLPPNSARDDALDKIGKLVDSWRKRYGTKPMSPVEALKIKQSGDRFLTRYWRGVEKGATDLMHPVEKETFAKGISGIRNALNQNPSIKALNRESGPLIDWLQDAERRVVMQGNKSLIPFGTAETIGVSKALGGNVAAATAAVGGRALLNQPSIASKAALMSRNMRQNQGLLVPPAIVNKAFEEYMRGGR